MTKAQSEAYHKGRMDYWKGQRINPYNYDPDLAMHWTNGYCYSCDKEIFIF